MVPRRDGRLEVVLDKFLCHADKCFSVNVVVGVEIKIERNGVVDLAGAGASEVVTRNDKILELGRANITLLASCKEVLDRLDNFACSPASMSMRLICCRIRKCGANLQMSGHRFSGVPPSGQ